MEFSKILNTQNSNRNQQTLCVLNPDFEVERRSAKECEEISLRFISELSQILVLGRAFSPFSFADYSWGFAPG